MIGRFGAGRRRYPSDIAQWQWDYIDLLLPLAESCGRKRAVSLREVVNALNYRWSTGCSWRMLPHDFPRWQTVYTHVRRWQRQGLLEPIRAILLRRDPPRNRSEEQTLQLSLPEHGWSPRDERGIVRSTHARSIGNASTSAMAAVPR